MKGDITKRAELSAEALESINGYTRRPYKAEELYTFSVVLCDNEADRDFECFTKKALERLASLFVGKTGIFDHDRSSRSQTARVYRTALKTQAGRETALGEPYTQLVAEAYVPRGERTADFIAAVESGILKEVSVGCAVSKRTCSVCGRESCGHVQGRLYDGARCLKILDEPTDAYEFSFVAVPAQRAAGVVKSYQKKEAKTMEAEIQKLFSQDSVTLSGEALREVRDAVSALEKRAASGDRYRASLSEGIMRLSAVAQPCFKRALVEEMIKNLSVESLEEMHGALERDAAHRMPLSVQTAGGEKTEKAPENTAFCI